jgi:hypothetical protein
MPFGWRFAGEGERLGIISSSRSIRRGVVIRGGRRF